MLKIANNCCCCLRRATTTTTTTKQALDVVSKMLAYDPLKRIKPLEVCSHDFVDEVSIYFLLLFFPFFMFPYILYTRRSVGRSIR